MFRVSSLTEEQKQQIHAWADQGAQMADIQKRMGEELGIQITYMDTRFLILDLGIELKKEEAPEVKEEETIIIPTGTVETTVDELMRPGALVSGRVTFSDGEKALWAIDQMGRLSLDADTPGYRPDDEDMITFQEQLRDKLAK